MPDILERLRDLRPGYGNVVDDAIAEIESLRGAPTLAIAPEIVEDLDNEVGELRQEVIRLTDVLMEIVHLRDQPKAALIAARALSAHQ